MARDISATVSALLDGAVDPGASIDADRSFALGHSLGGAAAMDACRSDARLVACVNMDGAPFGTATLEEGARGELSTADLARETPFDAVMSPDEML